MAVKISKAADDAGDTPFDDSVPAQDSAEVNAKKGKGKKAKKTKAKAPLQEKPGRQEVHQPKATITTKHDTGAETETQENALAPVLVSEPMANVGMSMGRTHNIGNFNNIKYSVSLYLPCPPTADGINGAYEAVERWLTNRMNELAEELSGELED